MVHSNSKGMIPLHPRIRRLWYNCSRDRTESSFSLRWLVALSRFALTQNRAS